MRRGRETAPAPTLREGRAQEEGREGDRQDRPQEEGKVGTADPGQSESPGKTRVRSHAWRARLLRGVPPANASPFREPPSSVGCGGAQAPAPPWEATASIPRLCPRDACEAGSKPGPRGASARGFAP